MKKRNTNKTYVTDKGVETYEYGYDLELSTLKIGDKVLVYGPDWWKGEYPDKRKCYIDVITDINLEKGFITLSNGINYKQAKETYRPYSGYKEIEYLDYFISTRDCDYIEKTCYDFYYKTIGKNNIKPRYVFLYDKNTEKTLNEFIEEVKQLDIERETKKIEANHKQEIYNKHQANYDAIVEPLKRNISDLEKALEDLREKTFDECFCKHCKTNNDYKCAFEREFYSNRIINNNHTFNYNGEILRTRPSEKCEYFEEKVEE